MTHSVLQTSVAPVLVVLTCLSCARLTRLGASFDMRLVLLYFVVDHRNCLLLVSIALIVTAISRLYTALQVL